MLIQLTKAKNEGKQDRLTCVRDDGSQTSWSLSAHFAQHDLLHYVVETTLGLEDAFFGLIDKGRDIDSFGTRDGEKDVYTKDEGDAELIVGLLQAQMRSSGTQSNAEFWKMLTLTCENRNWPTPQAFSDEDLDDIKQKISDLEAKWQRLPAGESLELVFPL